MSRVLDTQLFFRITKSIRDTDVPDEYKYPIVKEFENKFTEWPKEIFELAIFGYTL